MVQDFIARLEAFAKQPFRADGDVFAWGLFLIFAVTVMVLWRQTLAHVTED